MGVPRLKKKVELRYRKGHTNESMNCRFCENYVESVARCTIIGIQDGRSFDVKKDFTCDKQVYNEYIKEGK